MASLAGPNSPFPPVFHPRPNSKPLPSRNNPNSKPESPLLNKRSTALTVTERDGERRRIDIVKLKERESRERKEEINRKVASQKAISIILRREATKAVIEKKGGPNNSKKLLPRTVLEALHERIAALRWESALKVHHPLLFFFSFFFSSFDFSRLTLTIL